MTQDTIYRIFNCRFDEHNWDINIKPETMMCYCDAVFTAVKCSDTDWVNTLMVCNADLGADGPYNYFVRVGNLMDDNDIDNLIRHSFADSLAGEYGTWTFDEYESLFEWECVFNLTELYECDYLRDTLELVA